VTNGEPTIQDLLERIARLEGERDATQAHRRRRAAGGWRRLGAAMATALLVALVPLALLAAGPFTDLDPNSPHNGNIAAIQAAGITKGCDPPDFTQYCPKDYVTREEMASFLARTAGLGGNPPVANAKTALTATDATHATNADQAGNAAQLGGQLPSAFLPATGDLTYRYSFNNLVADPAQLTIVPFGKDVNVSKVVATGSGIVYLPLDRPTSMFGRVLAVKSARICYTTNGASISGTTLRATTEDDDTTLHQDTVSRPASPGGIACYDIAPDQVQAQPGALYLQLTLSFPTATDSIDLFTILLTLTPIAGGNP
jgi:hypothetical protein